jgi:hypothetical protein
MKFKILSVIFVALCIMSFFIINYYPVVDWVSAPILNLLILLPAILVEFILMIWILVSNKYLKVILFIQGFVTLICLSFAINYIIVH